MRLNKKDGLNIVPFIDIMLVLLAIVLSISTFIAQGKIAIDLPSANSAEQSKEDDKKEISENELKDKLNAVDIKTLIELKSDKNSKFDSFVKVIDILKEKGHENFAIQTISE